MRILLLVLASATLLLLAPAKAELIEVSSGVVAHIVDPPEPVLHEPRIIGTTPGRPFHFLIPATGEAPLRFSAEGLPEGIQLDTGTGVMSGSAIKAGKYEVGVRVSGPRGETAGTLTIVAGEDQLALTPPMGWNPWNVWARQMDQEKMRAAADALVSGGFAAHGYQYVNLDDTWQGTRDAAGVLRTNEKFPDMKALADYVHNKGLRFGVYSSPGRKSWAGHVGSYGHEEQDARMFADWGADYLKYDWCAYPAIDASMEQIQKPFRVMRAALDGLDRDIVFSGSPMPYNWNWGRDAGLNAWRVYADINDTWERVTETALWQKERLYRVGPGGWTDLDMLVIGPMKWNDLGQPRLSADEQISHMTLWSLMASPLLIGCDLTRCDAFTRDLLLNDDVIAVNQDRLGAPARCVKEQGNVRRAAKVMRDTPLSALFPDKGEAIAEVWARPMSDGSLAVAMINLDDAAAEVSVSWEELGISGSHTVRDLWQRKEVGMREGELCARLPRHGALFLKLAKHEQ